MLPFPRLVEYGNIAPVKHWYDGTDIMAFDSNIYNTAGFTDYVGNTMLVGTYVSGGVVPSINTTKQIFGNSGGIQFNYGGYIASNGKDVSTWLNVAWTVDFWIAETSSTPSTMQISCSPIAIYTNTAFNSYTNRFLLAEANQKINQWNNSAGASAVWSQTYTDLLSTNYVHWAIVYTGSNFLVFTNGILRETIAKAPFALPSPSNSLTLGLLGQGGYQPTKFSVIDRYRLRSGAKWTANFDTSTIYP